MIKPSDIVTHLQRYLSHYTTIFSSILNVNSITVAGNTFTVNAPANGLSINDSIVVSGGTFENQIVSVVDNGDGTLRFGTAQEHDMVEPKRPRDVKTLSLGGIGAPWDGSHAIGTTPNRMFFEIEFPEGETIPPDITNAILLEKRDSVFLGDVTVDSIIDADNFTFDILGVPSFPTGAVSASAITTNSRITGSSDIDRAQQFYTKHSQGEAFLFVVMNDADISKDRHMENDSRGIYSEQNLGKQYLLQRFSLVVFLPTDQSSTGFLAQDQAYDEIFRQLLRVLSGVKFPDPDTVQSSRTISTGHSPGVYTTAYYTHVYDWEYTTTITMDDNGFTLQPDVAFRDIDSSWRINNDPEAILDLGINLDKEPL